MKTKYLIPLFSVLLLIASCSKETPDVPDNTTPPSLDTGDLPYVRVNTIVPIENEPKISGSMAIFENQELVFSSPIGIEYRGSTSFRLSSKRSYGIETWDENGNDVNRSVFGFPEEEDWILNGHVFNGDNNTIFDPTLMHHYLGYSLYGAMERYASRTKFVELEVNDDYKGVYVFMEKLKRDSERIAIDKMSPNDTSGEALTGGYILKIDKTAGGDVAGEQPLSYFLTNWEDDARYSEEISFRSQYDIYGQMLSNEPFGPPYHSAQYLETYFLYEYPKANDITTQQKEYIQNYIHDFETALLSDDFSTSSRSYTEFIDLDSFVDFFIINEITGNVDGYRLSTFMHKPRGGKLTMGPIWDLNIGYNRQGRVPFDDWIINYNNHVAQDAWMVPFWWPRLLEDPIFRQRLQQRWQFLRGQALATSSVIGLVDQTANFLIDNGAIERNYARWTGIEVNYNEAVDLLKEYLRNRLAWMDQTIGNL